MSDLPVPAADHAAVRREEARQAAERIRALLATGPFEHHLGVNALAKIIADPNSPPREKRRAGEVLAKLESDLRQFEAQLSGSRDLALADLGIDAATRRAMTSILTGQVNIDSRQQILIASKTDAEVDTLLAGVARRAIALGMLDANAVGLEIAANNRNARTASDGSGHAGDGLATIEFPIPPLTRRPEDM